MSPRSMYIDVRGTWPILVEGMAAQELRGAPRLITVDEALRWTPPSVAALEAHKQLDAKRIFD